MCVTGCSLRNSKMESMDVFAESVKEAVEKKRPKLKVTVERAVKNNGSVFTGVQLSDGKSQMAPLIYLENFYKRYKMGLAFGRVIEEILALYEEKLSDEKLPDIGSWLYDFANVKERVFYQLINYRLNERCFESVPHIRFHDLAIVFRVMLKQEDDGIASLKITNEMAQVWDMPVKELFRTAHANTQRLFPEKIQKVADIIGKLAGESVSGQMGLDIPMYVATNQLAVDGAAVILYEGLLKVFSQRIGGDFFILPSSLHEVILIPAGTEMDVQELKELVREVNRTEVDTVDILSDTVYRYDADKNRIEIAAQ